MERLASTKEQPSDVSWHRSQEKREVLYSRQGEGGRTLVECLDPKGGKSRGARLRPRYGEYPREEKGSLLSQILEELLEGSETLATYSLTTKASVGVLRRASQRGKLSSLPSEVVEALNSVAQKSE